MKKKIFIFLLIFLVLAGAYSWYYVSQKNKEQETGIDNTLVYEDLLFYDSTYMNFMIKYPRNYEIYEKAIGANAQTNCITVSSVENSNSLINIGFEQIKDDQGTCFMSTSGDVKENTLRIAGKDIVGTQSVFDKDGITYVNALYKVENAKLDKKRDEYFAIQMQYPKNDESKYLKELEIIVNNFVWK